jgi:uncharacterized BrkB/YihY/UPF0761 family membrane protein
MPGRSLKRRREQLEALVESGQAGLERARSRSPAVDILLGMVRRERPVAVGILAGSLAFRLFALLVPATYVLVAGLGFARASAAAAGPGAADHLGEVVAASMADAARSSQRARWLALILGGVATLLAASAVLEVLRWIHLLAWRMAPVRARRPSPWLILALVAGLTAMTFASGAAEQARADARGLTGELTVVLVTAAAQLVVVAVLWLALSRAMPHPPGVPLTSLIPGAVVLAVGWLAFGLAVSLYFAPRAARASTVYGSLGTALVLLVSLFLLARLAVAAAELNAYLWERRRRSG